MGIRDRCKQAAFKKSIKQIMQEEEQEEFERTLSLLDLIMIGIGGTVGSGVFSTAGLIASSYSGPAAIVSWIIAGIGCILSGTSFMELSAILPVAGSTYAYSYYAIGELAAMIAGFLLTLEYGLSSAGGARSWSDKFTSLMADFGIIGPAWMKNGTVDLYAAILLLLCVSVVLRGMSTGKMFINVITAAKICVVMFIIILGLLYSNAENFDPFIPPSRTLASGKIVFGWPGIMLGASACFYGYIGYDEVCCLAAEAKNPKVAIPRAVIGTVLGASFLSTMATLALVGMQNYKDIDRAASYGKAFEHNQLNWAKVLVEIGEVVTMPVGVLIAFLAQPRLQYAMAKDGLLPKLFAKMDKKGNPFWGTLITGILLIITATFIEFSILWDFISLGILIAFNMTNISIILVRTRKKSPTLSPILAFLYWTISFASAFVWQKCIIAHDDSIQTIQSTHIHHWNKILAIALSIVSFLTVFSIWHYCPQSRPTSSGFRTPLVPWIPSIAIYFNWFLFAQMNWFSISMIIIWLCTAIIIYFMLGTFKTSPRYSVL